MKPLVFTILFFTFRFSVLSQNVGIGENVPTSKLTVMATDASNQSLLIGLNNLGESMILNQEYKNLYLGTNASTRLTISRRRCGYRYYISGSKT